MSFTDNWAQAYEAPALAANVRQQTQQNAFNLQLQQQGINALQNVDVNDPASVNSALSGLLKAGMVDQAKGLTDLAMTRGINTASLPVIQQALSQSGQTQQSSSQGQFDRDKYQRMLTDSSAALSDLVSLPPEQRQARADQWRNQLKADGVADPAIDNVIGGDLTDDAVLKSHQALVAQEAQQFAVTHSPGYQQAAAALESGLANPVVMGALGKAGIDTSGGLNLAANITSPVRGAQVQQAYAPSIAGATTAATEAAAAPYELVPGITDPETGAPLYRSRAEFAASRPGGPGAPIAPPAPGATGGGFPAQGAAPGTVSAATVGGTQAQTLFNADNATAAGMQATVTPLRQILDKLPTTNIGPGTEQTNELRSFIIAQLPWLTKLDPTYWNEAKIQTAQYNELKKYMTQLATTGLNGVFGQGSDQRFAAIVSGNPHITMDQLSAKQVTELAMAGVRAQAAAPLVFARQGLPVTDYPAWKAKFGSTVDPRGFMLDILSPTERKAMLAQIPRNSTEAANLKTAKNYAEQIGMYQDSDIPR